MGDASLVVRAVLDDEVTPAIARLATAVQALNRSVGNSNDQMSQSVARSSQRTNAEIFKLDNAMRGSARRMASRILLIGAVIAAAAGHAVAFTAALWPLIGALGAVPAVAVGFVAGIAALITGFSGLGAAMKKTGGGSSNSASQITAAQRRIEMANRSLRDSQEALNDAWEEARDNLRDIQTQYAGAQLDVEAAALAVRDAEIALREARSSGDRQERLRADLALRQARLNQIEATNRLSDVEQEFNERMASGVEGSEEVRDATERHADALHELAEAQDAMNEAMKGGGGGGDDAYSKLSASGRKLVDTLRALGPAWREVKQATQEAMLVGVADSIQRISDLYLPVMLKQLPGVAAGWNNLFQSVLGVASQDSRLRDIDESLGLMGVMWQKVGTSFGKFFSGFLDWVRVGSDFLPRLGDWVDRLASKFETWSKRVRETGKAHQWIENALVAGHKFNLLMQSWSRSLFEIIRLGQDRTLIDRLIEGSHAFERWLASAEGQERITAMWARMREIGSAAWEVIKEALDVLSQIDISPLADILSVLADVLGFVADNMDIVNSVVGPLLLGLTVLKVTALAGSLAVKALGLAMGTTATATKAATVAVGAFQRALGWVTIGLLLFDIQKKESDTWNMRVKGSTDELTGAVGATAEQYRIAARDLETYSDLLRAETDPVFAFIHAQEQVAAAQERVNATAAEYGEGSPEHIQAVRDLQQATLDLNAAAVEASKINQDLLIPQLQKLEDQGLLAAGTTQAIADAMGQANQRTLDYQTTLNSLNGTRVTVHLDEIVTTYGGGGAKGVKYGGGIQIMHEGGIVPGTRGQEIAAILEAGERVIPADEVRDGYGGEMKVCIEIDVRGGDDALTQWLRKAIRVKGARSFGLAAGF